MMFDYMGILLDKQAMADYDFTMNVILSDLNEKHMVRVKNGVLLHYENGSSESPHITITCPKNALFLVLQNNTEGLKNAAKIEGDRELFELFMGNLNQLNASVASNFNIIEP